MSQQNQPQVQKTLESLIPNRKHTYGWRPDNKDIRDIKKTFDTQEVFKINKVTKLDHRDQHMPPVYDQGTLGSCTANAICGAFKYQSNVEKINNFDLSRLFVYYNERAIEGTIMSDAGASIRDGFKTINVLGICPEIDHPYVIKNFTVRPSPKAYLDAKDNKCTKYMSIRIHASTFKTALNNKYLVVFGFSVPDYFEDDVIAKTGIMPNYTNQTLIGGHAVVAVGYDDNMEANGTKGFMLIRNSWGPEWGQGGYFWMSYAFVNSGLLSDAWVVEVVT